MRMLGGGLVAVAATLLAVLECFFLLLRVGSIPVPLSIAVAVLANAGLPVLAYRVSGSRVAAVLPVAAWLAVVVLAAVPRPEGDVIVTSTLRGVAFLVLGAVAGAYAVGRLLARPPTASSR